MPSKQSVLLLSFLILSLLVACTAETEPVAQADLEPTFTLTAVPSATAVPATNTPIPPPAAATPQPTSTSTLEPGVTPSPTAIPTETPSPTAVPLSGQINGVLRTEFIIAPPETIANIKNTFSAGQAAGRNPYAFSKLGDSVIANGDFLTRFDDPAAYTLGPDYEQFQAAIDHFSGSYERYGVGMKIGLHAWGVFNPTWANKDWCEPNEVMIDCEFRLNNPAIVLIHLGTNDTGDTFEEYLRLTMQTSLENGVIPVLMTKSDRFEGEDNRNNIVIRKTAADFQVPLIDFDIVAETLPNRGLIEGDVHLNGPNMHDYTLPIVFEKGHTVHNLTVLMMLETLLQEVVEPGLSS